MDTQSSNSFSFDLDTIKTATTTTITTNDTITTNNSSGSSSSSLTGSVSSVDDVQLQPLLSQLPVFPSVGARAAVSAVLTTHFGPTKDRMIPFDLEILGKSDAVTTEFLYNVN